MIERITRPPNARDRDSINSKIATLEKDRREEILLSSVVAGLGVIVAGVVLYLNRPAGPLFTGIVVAVLVFAVVFGGPTYTGWRSVVDWKALRESTVKLAELRALLAGPRLHVMHCTASALVAIGDAADDVDEYVFQVDDSQMLVLPSWAESESGFPGSELEIVAVTDDFKDFLAIHSLGARLKPDAIIDPEKVQHPDYPFDALLVAGRINDLTRARGQRT
jgi:hypothetical protein